LLTFALLQNSITEDMDVAPDFFSYFSSTVDLLEADPSLLCISAWNDNGLEGFVTDSTAFYRSDFFPVFSSLFLRYW
jgi:alpha-1,3-mannosyl-glycoprotein beta-1,2-N-acetylglucosaminyltransferase